MIAGVVGARIVWRTSHRHEVAEEPRRYSHMKMQISAYSLLSALNCVG